MTIWTTYDSHSRSGAGRDSVRVYTRGPTLRRPPRAGVTRNQVSFRSWAPSPPPSPAKRCTKDDGTAGVGHGGAHPLMPRHVLAVGPRRLRGLQLQPLGDGDQEAREQVHTRNVVFPAVGQRGHAMPYPTPVTAPPPPNGRRTSPTAPARCPQATAHRCGWWWWWGVAPAVPPPDPPPPPCVTFRRVVVSLRGPGQSPARPFACCVGSLRSVGRCGRCSCWCRFPVRGAQ